MGLRKAEIGCTQGDFWLDHAVSRLPPSASIARFGALLPTSKGGNVTKQDFIDQVAERGGLSKKDATDAVEAVLGQILDSLVSGEDINFTGFGKFHVAERGPRQGVNPQTRERITIPGGKVPRFSAGSALKKAVKAS